MLRLERLHGELMSCCCRFDLASVRLSQLITHQFKPRGGALESRLLLLFAQFCQTQPLTLQLGGVLGVKILNALALRFRQ